MAAEKNKPQRQLEITRVLDAPRALVFAAWTDPKHMARWWGPKCFINPVCEVDARPGGALRIVMRGPDGAEHPMRGAFREVVEPERLVFVATPEDVAGKPLAETLTTVTFADFDGGKTKLTLHTRAVGLAPVAAQMLEGMEAGWTQTINRLVELVKTIDREIVSVRVFNAPRELVFRAWTEPEHLVRWWGPKGFTNTFHEFDLRPGGNWRFVMHGPDGTDYKNHVVFTEIVLPERIVLDHISPPRFELTATFTDVGGKTRVLFRQLFEHAKVRDGVAVYAVPANEENFDRLQAELATMG
jgi:uncharacterized protein YndB with AHSA1/START domain